MSIHKSLRKLGTLSRHRNVMTRAERLQVLIDEGKATDATSVYGLPKLRSIQVKAKAKVKAEPAAGAAATPAAGAAGAAPAAAAGAKPAAGAKAAAPAAAAKAAAPGKK